MASTSALKSNFPLRPFIFLWTKFNLIYKYQIMVENTGDYNYGQSKIHFEVCYHLLYQILTNQIITTVSKMITIIMIKISISRMTNTTSNSKLFLPLNFNADNGTKTSNNSNKPKHRFKTDQPRIIKRIISLQDLLQQLTLDQILSLVVFTFPKTMVIWS